MRPVIASAVQGDDKSGFYLCCLSEPLSDPSKQQCDGNLICTFPNEVATQWLRVAIELLRGHWSRSEAFYEQQLVQARALVRVLPCSYVLVKIAEGGHECLGHIRVEETFDAGSAGCCCACTFVIVNPSYRGRGIGRILMSLAELEASALGYHYMYLWTKDAVPFYERCGYTICMRVSIYRPVLRSLGERGISALEAMLAHKIRHGSADVSCDNAVVESAAVATSDPASCEVWLRRRLREELSSEAVSRAQRMDELRTALTQMPSRASQWHYRLQDVPWQRQVGPSCALAAVRMVRDAFLQRELGQEVRCHGSLLAAALERGVTSDGEIYDLSDLLKLSQDICGLQGSVIELQDLLVADLASLLEQGRLMLLPYDAEPSTKQPASLQGLHAHCGIVVAVCWVCRDAGVNELTQDLIVSLEHAAQGELPQSDEDVILAVQHSASKRLAVAPLSAWRSSNGQLDAYDRATFKVKDLNLSGKALLFKAIV